MRCGPAGRSAPRAAAVDHLGPGHRDGPPPRASPSRSACRSTSATRNRPGSAAATRTPTGCCATTSPRAPTSASTPGSTSWRSRTSSTPAPGSCSMTVLRGAVRRVDSFLKSSHRCDVRLNPPRQNWPSFRPALTRQRKGHQHDRVARSSTAPPRDGSQPTRNQPTDPLLSRPPRQPPGFRWGKLRLLIYSSISSDFIRSL